MKLPEIVGIAGTNASGKDTLGLLRASISGAKMVSCSDILRRELDKRGMTHERENLRAVGDEWRAQEGLGVLAAKTIQEYRNEGSGHGLTITSIRHPKEVEAIKQAGGIVVWVDADIRIRYERTQHRDQDRPEDRKTFEQFKAEEAQEMTPPADNPNGLNLSGVRDQADITLENNFRSLEEYEAYLKAFFEL